MKTKMTLWGVGPKFALLSFVFSIIMMSIHYFTKPLFIIDAVPQSVISFTAILLLITGIPFFLLSAKTISKVYAQNSLCTSGVYSTCRHPLYSSFIFFLVPGIVLFLNSWLLLTLPFVMYVIFRILIKKEENYLKDEFGEEFIIYKKNVDLVFPMLWKLFSLKK